MTWRDAAPPALPALLAAKQVDGIGQFSVASRSSRERPGGKAIRSFKYAKVMPGMLGIRIIASDDKIRSSPGEVRAFTHALLRGLRYAIDIHGEAGTSSRSTNPGRPDNAPRSEHEVLRPEPVTRRGAKGSGVIDVRGFNATASVIRNGFKLSGRLNAADTWSPVAVNVRRAGR